MLVYGDTNSTLAGALAARPGAVPVGHVEAGMRSFDRAMPEELNRVLADHASDLLLCSTETAMGTWSARASRGEVHLVGDVMADVSLAFRDDRRGALARPRRARPRAGRLSPGHRPPGGQRGRPRAPRQLVELLEALPRPVRASRSTRARAPGWRTPACGAAGRGRPVLVLPPLGYLDFLKLARHARAVLTDSGGVQKEAYLLGVPCVTLRERTEWVETVDAGWNTLVGLDREAALAALERPPPAASGPSCTAAGSAAERVGDVLSAYTAAP